MHVVGGASGELHEVRGVPLSVVITSREVSIHERSDSPNQGSGRGVLRPRGALIAGEAGACAWSGGV
eukprot:4703739-Prymnesium_polylepis.1